MQKVVIIVKKPVAEIGDDGKAFVRYKVDEETHLTASTKSTNNLVDDLKQLGTVPTETKVEDFFLNKEETYKIISEMVEKLNPKKELNGSVVSHIMKALDGACVFKKPPIVRKKA